ncbi:MAG: hypothetical protein QM535_19110, partial [Limnohabitans sp.]|nr:hypothetical protein [Limnohabitans sp.]
IERDSLQAQLDSLTLEIIKLTKIIITKDSQKSKYQEICELKSIQENKNGKQEVFSSIIITYKNKTLDELIENSTLSSVQRDASIIGNNTEIQQILLSMQTYYNSKRVLDEKYNKQNVENAITQLKTIEQTKQVLNLIEKLSDYELRNNALKKTIDKITDIDINFKANDDFTQKEKFKDIIVELSWYFRNYQFNMKDYPYLTEKILEIIKLKQKDANENIAYLKEKL